MNARESENYLQISRSSRLFGPRYIGDDFFRANLVSFNRTVEISRVNFRVETKILVRMSEEI